MQVLGKKECLSFDISIDSDSGTRAVDMVQKYVEELPGLQQLAMGVKQALKVSAVLVDRLQENHETEQKTR